MAWPERFGRALVRDPRLKIGDYPGTRVLKNKLDIKDAARLALVSFDNGGTPLRGACSGAVEFRLPCLHGSCQFNSLDGADLGKPAVANNERAGLGVFLNSS